MLWGMMTHASMRPCEFGNGMLLPQKSNVCRIDWAVSSYDTDTRAWKDEDESSNGKIFSKVSPAVLGR